MSKTYVGKGRASDEFDLVNISICVTDIPKDQIFEYEGKKYMKLTVARMKEPDKYGKTHTVYMDEYKPKQDVEPEVERDDLPF